jgi:hypothetical protein
MSFRSNLWISAAALGALTVPALAANNPAPPTPPAPPAIMRTFVFPAVGLASSESARIAAVNIAPASHKGTAASCSGTISFTNASGAPVGKPAQFSIGTGDIAYGDVLGLDPSSNSVRNEFQGSVQVTIDPASGAPCSLLLTLEVFDTATGVTHGLMTSAIDAPMNVEPTAALGHGSH